MSYSEVVAQDCRLIMLRALAAENDYSLNETILVHALEEFGHRKARGYVRQQLAILEADNEAVTTREAGTVMIATITQRGLDHIEGRAVLDGVKRPSPKA